MLRLAPAISLFALASGPVLAASPLTCEAFKARLSDAIEVAGNKVAHIREFKLANDSSGIKRYDWNGIVGLEGSLLCTSNDRFDRFDIVIDIPGNRDAIAALPRMRDLASATICSVTEARPIDCDILANNMFQAASAKLGREVKRGEELPTGSSDFDLSPNGWWASLSADDVSLIFGFGPGVNGTAERQKLNPVKAYQ